MQLTLSHGASVSFGVYLRLGGERQIHRDGSMIEMRSTRALFSATWCAYIMGPDFCGPAVFKKRSWCIRHGVTFVWFSEMTVATVAIAAKLAVLAGFTGALGPPKILGCFQRRQPAAWRWFCCLLEPRL